MGFFGIGLIKDRQLLRVLIISKEVHMKSDLFDHKVRVFISSIVKPKYTSVRKSLKHLLEETSMVDAYAFETSCASSQKARVDNHYLVRQAAIEECEE